MRTSDNLKAGEAYSRKRLADLFGITDATLNTGIFRPKGHDSVWLFVTEHKTADRTQYEDRLEGDDLFFAGQTQGRTDNLILEHRELGLELLLFHRQSKSERPDYSFLYKGPFEFVSAQQGPPTQFHLRRTAAVPRAIRLELVTTDVEIRENVRRFCRDQAQHPDRANSLVRQTILWVFDEHDAAFGPSKFVGYSRMSFGRYEAAVQGPTTGAAFDGHVAHGAIAKLLGEFMTDSQLAARLRDQLVGLLGGSGADGIDTAKWKFARVKSARQYWALVCNPSKFDGLSAVASLEELAWTVDRGEFHVGDRVAIWQSKGAGDRRGVIALGEVVRGVEAEPCPEGEARFWTDLDLVPRPRVRIRILPNPRLPMWESDNPWLTDLAAARARGGTVFSLEELQWSALVAPRVGDGPVARRAPGSRRSSRQGYGLSSELRRAVELRAQQLAEEHFLALGFEVEDVSARTCYDLRCTRGVEEVRVEVKGTTGVGETVFLTRNEVAHAREHGPRMALVIVSGILVNGLDADAAATGGSLRVTWPWSIDDGALAPFQYEYRPGKCVRPGDSGSE